MRRQQRAERALRRDRCGEREVEAQRQPRDPPRERRDEHEDSERRAEGQLEADVGHRRGPSREQHQAREPEEVGGVGVGFERPAGQHRCGHEGRAHDRHVPADERGVGRYGDGREERLEPGTRAQPAQPTRQQQRDERHLRSRERQHVIRPRCAERLGRALVDLGAVPEHHREHEPALGTRWYRPREDATGAVPQPGDEPADGRPTIGGKPLDEARRLAVAERGEPLVRRSVGRTQGHPRRDPVAVEKPGRLRRPP
jgi:hypothetical protein